MGKTYPGQRWPDRNKNEKKKSEYQGQTSEPPWKKSSIEDLKKDLSDEKDDEKAYRDQAKRAPPKKAKKTLTAIANDEKEHQVRVKRLLKESGSKSGRRMYRVGNWFATREQADRQAEKLGTKKGVKNIGVEKTTTSKYGEGYYVDYDYPVPRGAFLS
jgi:rubrerythrin